jgi:hypothetical protein
MSSAQSPHHDGSGLQCATAACTRVPTQTRSRRSRRHSGVVLALAAFATLAAWGAPAARADEASTIIERCTHGQSLAGFSRRAYAKALRELPTDVSEYSDCEELIRKAALAAAGGIGGGPGAGGAPVAPPTPAEQAVLASAAHSRSAPIRVGGSAEQPGVVPVSLASALNSLPAPLMALLAALIVSGAVLAGNSLRRMERVPSLPIRLPRRK